MAPAGRSPAGRPIVVLHSSPVIADAVRDELWRQAAHRRIRTVYSWADFARTWDFSSTWVVLDAYLDDHVPLALKVRSLVRVRSGAIVLGALYSPALRTRAMHEGATAWLEPTLGLGALAERIAALSVPAPRRRPRSDVRVRLTDRELQLATLHASRRAMTPAALARSLGLSVTTVKSHIASTRRKYRMAGVTVHTRQELADALVADGYLISEQDWQRQARW